ncbi:MAG TPA: hypothetical protein VIM31_00105 [Candidatus Microsaccharimonas sp.]|jgi:hypothetical protein
MEPGDIIRNRVAARNEGYANDKVERKEAELVTFEESVQKVADAIVATDYAGCSIYKWEGEEYIGIELYQKRYSDYGPDTEGFLLHLLVGTDNHYRVILQSSLTPEKGVYGYRLDYEGGVNSLEGEQFDPRTDIPAEEDTYNHFSIGYNQYRMKSLLENYEKIKRDGPYKGNEAWYRV